MEIPKILLVDDRRENILVLEAILERPDLDIFFATSGYEALDLLDEHEFALVLLDVQMPGMSGLETAEIMRSREKTVYTPIIFLTAVSKEEQHVFAGYEKGAVDYLPKPVDEIILRSKVNVFVDLYNQKRTLEKANGELRVALGELERSNRTILENQRALIEEQLLKLLLQVSGITTREMTGPLNSVLQNLDSLSTGKGRRRKHGAGTAGDAEEIREAGTLLHGVTGRIHEMPDFGTANSHLGRVRTIAAGEQGRAEDPDPVRPREALAILCVDDDYGYFHLLSTMLAELPRTRMIYAGTCAAAEELLSLRERPDLILLEHSLPDGDSCRILSFLTRRDLDVPVIVITGHGDETVAARAMKLGAVDYLPKAEVCGERLLGSIRSALEQRRVKRDLRKAMSMMADMANRDSLTGLYNRRYFLDALQREVAREERYKSGLSLCMIDIDFFKSINDTYGHAAGDRVLQELASLMRETMRETDIVCRCGGEEFFVIFPNTREDRAHAICERFGRIVHMHVFSPEQLSIRTTVSIGLTGFRNGDGASTTRLVERTDKELYRAKTEGRNRVCRAGKTATYGLPQAHARKAVRLEQQA